MNNRFLTTTLLASAIYIAGCSDDNSSFETPNTSGTASNSGVVSQTNFSLLTADIYPAIIDGTTGDFTKTDVELTVFIGDRNNQVLTDAHTVHFVAEYGLIEPSCVTEDGTCSVTWSAIKRPVAGGPASDGFVTITAYTLGEEGFTDTNGNGVFDDGDTGFVDLEEPYVDADYVFSVASNGFSTGDVIINVPNTLDPSGTNLDHDIADGLYNGPACTHSFSCGTTSIMIFDSVAMSIISDAVQSRTIGGTVTGLAGTGLVLQNNGGDDKSITTDGAYTFDTTVDDGQTYTVTVLTQPTSPGQVCTVANASDTVSANVTNVDVTCATNTFTIGGTVTGIPGGESVVLQNNAGDNLTVSADGPFQFATPIADGSAYNVTILTDPASATCTVSGGTGTGTVSNANVTNVTIGCI